MPALLTAVLTAAVVAQPAPQLNDPLEPCAFPPHEVEWLQRALDGWEQAGREFLRVDPAPLPWIVLFDTSCVWHLAPDGTPPGATRPIQSRITLASPSSC